MESRSRRKKEASQSAPRNAYVKPIPFKLSPQVAYVGIDPAYWAQIRTYPACLAKPVVGSSIPLCLRSRFFWNPCGGLELFSHNPILSILEAWQSSNSLQLLALPDTAPAALPRATLRLATLDCGLRCRSSTSLAASPAPPGRWHRASRRTHRRRLRRRRPGSRALARLRPPPPPPDLSKPSMASKLFNSDEVEKRCCSLHFFSFRLLTADSKHRVPCDAKRCPSGRRHCAKRRPPQIENVVARLYFACGSSTNTPCTFLPNSLSGETA